MTPRRASVTQEDAGQFRSLRASLLFCPKCQTATPARERLLLVLPTGYLYETYNLQKFPHRHAS
ncbi:MAG: hypothetical protein AB7P17_12085 [Nitrospirales bacterium]